MGAKVHEYMKARHRRFTRIITYHVRRRDNNEGQIELRIRYMDASGVKTVF